MVEIIFLMPDWNQQNRDRKVTLQSESVRCDDFHIMDVVTNGISRLRLDFIGPRDNSKRFSLLYLLMPTTCLFTSHYLITISIYDWIYVLARRYVVSAFVFQILLTFHLIQEINLTFILQLINLKKKELEYHNALHIICTANYFRIGNHCMRKQFLINIFRRYLQL